MERAKQFFVEEATTYTSGLPRNSRGFLSKYIRYKSYHKEFFLLSVLFRSVKLILHRTWRFQYLRENLSTVSILNDFK
jgi:hypothetical protein